MAGESGIMQTFSQVIATPENCSALEAVWRVAAYVGTVSKRSAVNPLLLHGPSGAGKTHLVSALATEAVSRQQELTVAHLAARTLGEALRFAPKTTSEPPSDLTAARDCDLLIVEDLQHLPAVSATGFGQLLDFRCARRRQTVLTSTAGPAQLTALPVRLTSRLAAGLVVGLEAYGAASRRLLLEALARRRRLTVGSEVLAWLADHLPGSGRQLEGALVGIEALTALGKGPLDVATVASHFGGDPDANRSALDRITEQVGRYFQVEPRQIKSSNRRRQALLARQVSTYLARQLTALSLAEIGAFFGGRNHSTVLHACRKVEQALIHDASLAAAIRQLSGELSHPPEGPSRQAG
jgi:chromosomal replication initiator protein